MTAHPTAAAKTERLLNLIICLLWTRRPLSKARIRSSVPQYQDTASAEAFDRMFERDKDELRELGIPLVTSVIDPLFDDEVGYRIDQREYALPEIAFEPDEVAALGLAGRAWTQASLAGSATAALRKLRSAGVELDDSSLVGIEPRVRTAEAAFDPVRKAVFARQPISFTYRKPEGDSSVRSVQPWALSWWRGRWYLTGHDLERDAERVFRLSRIEGAVRSTGSAGGYVVPADHDPKALISVFDPVSGQPQPAVLRIRPGTGNVLRRRARTVGEGDDGWSLVDLDYSDVEQFADEISGFGPDVVVEKPEELRAAVVRRLRGALARHTGEEVVS